jgi:hypothetical protein
MPNLIFAIEINKRGIAAGLVLGTRSMFPWWNGPRKSYG